MAGYRRRCGAGVRQRAGTARGYCGILRGLAAIAAARGGHDASTTGLPAAAVEIDGPRALATSPTTAIMRKAKR